MSDKLSEAFTAWYVTHKDIPSSNLDVTCKAFIAGAEWQRERDARVVDASIAPFDADASIERSAWGVAVKQIAREIRTGGHA